MLVTCRSAHCLPGAVESFRRECQHQGYTGEVIVVDHSEDSAERERIANCDLDRLLTLPNRGFAAGINAGVAEASGDLLLAGNPDIELHPGALASMVDALQGGWDIVGPQFVLGDFLLPPSDLQTPREELARLAAVRWPGFGRRVLVRQARRWCATWEAQEPLAAAALSGALLAYSAETARRVGRWDEEYFLYFEETDWLRRASQAGLRIGLVPQSRVTHAWGHAADPASFQEVFLRSRHRFYSRHFGAIGRWLGEQSARPAVSQIAELSPATLQAVPKGCWWLLAFSPEGLPALGTRETGAKLAAAVRDFLTLQPACPDPFLIAFDPRRGSVIGSWRWAGGRSIE